MKTFLTLATLMLLGIATGGPASAAAICPSTANTNSDCGFLITIAPDGSLSGAAVAGALPYDGSDDALVGVINQEATAFTGSFTLSGSGNGGGLFAFDGDGICAYVTCTYTSTYGYEGPNNTFTSINPAGSSGTVLFNLGGGIAAGSTSYFSLEGSPSSILAGGGIGVPVGGGGTTVPEPASFALLGAGLVALYARRKRG